MYENGEQNMGGQRVREKSDLPDWMRDHMDREKQLEIMRRKQQPELYAQLDRIEAKLDQLLNRKK